MNERSLFRNLDTRSHLKIGVCVTLNEGKRLAKYSEDPIIYNKGKSYESKGIGTFNGQMVWIFDGNPGILPLDQTGNICDYDYE